MFAIALVLWLIVIVITVCNHKKQNLSFRKKHSKTLAVLLFAIILTVADIWLFIFYIPQHFRKNNIDTAATLTINDIEKDSTTVADTTSKISSTAKDTSTIKNAVVAKPVSKIYTTNKASIKFFSSTSVEDIEAINSNTVCTFNTQTGDIRFLALIKSFHFENELMQDHFNTPEYMNSDAFPKSEFKGTIQNIASIDFQKDGKYNIKASGNLTIHGVTKSTTADGTLTVKNGKANLKSVFKIKRLDFGITTDEVSETIEITVTAPFN